MATRQELIKEVNATMRERARRLKVLKRSKILPTDDVDVEAMADVAVAHLAAKPARIFDWFSEEEIALLISLEEI